jgi:two-component system, NtrC family, response regulator AtoC
MSLNARKSARSLVHEDLCDRSADDISGRDAGAGSAIIDRIDARRVFIAASPAMREVHRQIEQLAGIDAAVLLIGESGTGKELVARTIHKLSSRRSCDFLKTNCAALPPDLLQRELFGNEPGAFPGAEQARTGKFEAAHEGTLLLDHISAIPLSSQPKLLHLLQDGEFARIGATSTTQSNVRVIAATDSDLRPAIQEGRFRADLYFRLNCFTIHLPPLRERREDLPHLLNYFMGTWSTEYARKRLPITPTIIEASSAYAWPGNLRELENFVKRYLVLADENLALAQLESELEPRADAAADSDSTVRIDLAAKDICDLKSVVRDLKHDAEKAAILQALERTNGNKQDAAGLLHISLRALHYKVRAYGIESASLRAKSCVGFPDSPPRTPAADPALTPRGNNAGKILTMYRPAGR